jgi:hypothetical protein
MAYNMMRDADRAFTNELENEYLYKSIFDSDGKERDSKTVFVAIPCYRDEELVATIDSIYLNAKNPDRIFVGVGLAHKKEDKDYWTAITKKYKNVTIIAKEALPQNVGLGNQRADANDSFNDQDFYLQIDAHMRFDMHWDDLLIHHYDNLKRLGDPKPLITGYPRAYAPDIFPSVEGAYPYYNPMSKEVYFRQRRGHNNIPCFRVGLDPAKFFAEIGFPRHGDRIFTRFETIAFTYAVSPAQIFTEGSFVKEVPANRKIRFLEEEQYYSILAYMKGYNFYVPRVTGVMHYYSEAYNQVLIDNRNHPIQEFPDTYVAEKYIEDKVGGLNIFTALKKLKGTARSFSDYERFASVDYENRRLIAPVNKIVHNKITEAVNFSTEIYEYSINDYIDWMYDAEYTWYEDVKRNEGPIK